VVREKEVRNAFDETFSGNLGLALAKADLIYIALPIAVTLDLFSEIARHAPTSALVTDACSTKLRVMEDRTRFFPEIAARFFSAAIRWRAKSFPELPPRTRNSSRDTLTR